MILLALILCFFVLNALYFITNSYKKEIMIFHAYNEISDMTEIINIGSGPSLFAFDWSASDRNGCNLAVWPQDFRYDYRMAKTYLDKIKFQKGLIILHVISPLSFLENKYLETVDFSCKYVPVLSAENVDIPKYKYILEKWFPIASSPRRIKKIVKFLMGRDHKRSGYFEDEDLSEYEKKQMADNMVKGWIKENPGLMDLKDCRACARFEKSFKRNVNFLNEMYAYCMANDYQYYAVIPPISQYLRDKFSLEFLERALLDNIRKSMVPEQNILNYLLDDDYAEMQFYLNGLFLNAKVRKKFTKKVCDDIDNI